MYLQFILSLKSTGGGTSPKQGGEPRKGKRGFPKAGNCRGKNKGNPQEGSKGDSGVSCALGPEREKSRSELLQNSGRDFLKVKLIE